MSDPLEVHLYGWVVGYLHRAGADTVDFESDDTAISRFGLASPILSASLPLSVRRSGQRAATAFFGGLFPEGRRLTNLAKQAGCHRHDVFSLIEYAGRDVAGAVQIGARGEIANGEYDELGEEEVAQRLDRVNDYALGSLGGGGSLAGFQPKTTLAWRNGRWHAGINGAPSTHILKPIALGSEQTLHTEAYTLTLSRKLNLSESDSRIELFSGRPVLVIERYDRTILRDGTVRRIHQEDAAQALGLPWDTDAKFEAVDGRAKLRNVARLLPARQTVFDSGRDDREGLLAYTTFNVAVGNTDAHAKNFSTLHHEDGQVELAPLYDISTHALMPGGTQNMSMWVNGNVYQPDITRDDLIAEAGMWGLPTGRSKKVINETLERLRYAVEDTDPGAAGERVGLYIAAQAQNLLDGQRAAVSSTGPVSIAAIEPPHRMPSR